MSDKTQILVLGAGYAGLATAARLANRLHPDDVAVTLVSAAADVVERPRLHQVATGQTVRPLPVRELLGRSPVTFRQGTVVDIRPNRHDVLLADGDALPFDRLVVGLGSQVDRTSVPGADRHALALTDRRAAEEIGRRLDALPAGARVAVVGGGLTGIETAGEVAEAHPRLSVLLVSADEPGAWLSRRARGYLGRVLDALGVVRVAARVVRVDAEALVLDDEGAVPFDLCLWAGGFRPSPLVAASGLSVDASGRALVDRTLRSRSHPDVWVVGDAAAVPGPWGEALAMGCRTSTFTARPAADSLAAGLTGGRAHEMRFRYLHECVSVGRRHGFVQLLDRDGHPLDRVLTGRAAIAYKNVTLDAAHVLFRHPGPAVGRRRAAHDEHGAGRREPVRA